MSVTAPDLLLRQYDYWRTVYRRTWKGTVITSFVSPLFYVASMGLLLGGYVDRSSHSAALEGAPSYLAFIAPGLLAAQAMQVAAGETLWPVMGGIKWNKTYYGMIATPLCVSDVVVAHLAFVGFRIATSCAVFALVLAPFGVYRSVTGVLVAYAAALLTGMAFACPIFGFSAGVKSESWFSMVLRLGIMPMFLFSGAFFPISNLSPPLEALAKLTPLWQGVDLARMGTLDRIDLSTAAAHAGYLLVLSLLGLRWAVRRLTRRLVV